MLKLNQKLLLMLDLDTEVMVDTVMVATEDTEDTEAMGDTDMVAMEDTEAMEATVDLDTGDSMEK